MLLPTCRVRVADDDVVQIAPLGEVATATTTLMANELASSTFGTHLSWSTKGRSGVPESTRAQARRYPRGPMTRTIAATMAEYGHPTRQEAQRRRPARGKERAFVGQAEPIVGVPTHRVARCHGVSPEHRGTVVPQPGEMW